MNVARSLVLIAGAALSANAFAQDLPTQKVLTLDVAQTIAHEAMAQCRANGYKVTVTVVDGANILKAFLRDDGASMATVEVGRMKANSVMAFGRPSGPPANLPPGTPAPPPVLPGTINAMGGVPIKAGDQLIGAVSVSGAPGGDKDAACANAALAKVADKLK
ncbi:MAG: heme-binding protein [Bryobacterales bacterium]|nr:heme-binding protein [Bryobacterales bacterium]